MKKSKKRQLIMNMLFQAVNLWQQRNTKESEDGLTLRQFMLLSALKENEKQKINLSALAESFGGSRQNARQLATVLARKGFLCIEQSEADKREMLISLTEKGRACFDENEDAEDALIRPVFAGIGEKTLDGAMECLEIMIKNLSEEDAFSD